MNKHLRSHVGRRREAIDRLQSLTTGAIVAGTAGTIGFGFLAAATFTGNSTTQAATDDNQPSTIQSQSGSGRSGTNRDQTNATNPSVGGLRTAPTPRPVAGRQGHAATGGSG